MYKLRIILDDDVLNHLEGLEKKNSGKAYLLPLCTKDMIKRD